ncbi:autotransporter assembly complex family protein [Paracoccus sp. p4-l81]|uniref:autotransporter assembly complex protein TamA n=1 Tax=Paracoccus sp. p4-l81 TaxID=3342806 RepID=UPI0035BB5B5A
MQQVGRGFRMNGTALWRALALGTALTAAGIAGPMALAQDVQILPTGNADLDERMANASLLIGAVREDRTTAQDLLAAAQADYARLLAVLYEAGHYGPVINILVDGREAATIPPLDAPRSLRQVQVRVDPGPLFHFSRAQVAPVAPGTELPDGFARGEPALSGLVGEAARAGVQGWRKAGHAKADVTRQDITAQHPTATLSAVLDVAPGPVVRFGKLILRGYDRMNPRRLAKIAGLPEGEVFTPEALETVRKRLTRTGVFSGFTLDEAERLGPGNTMDVTLTVIEHKPRRLGFGAEISTDEGGMLSAYWLHRNLLGGAERFRIDAKVSGLGTPSGADYKLDLRIDRPATLTADTTAYLEAGVARLTDPDITTDSAQIGLGFSHIFSDTLTGTAGFSLRHWRGTDPVGSFSYTLLAAPITLTWDRRDDKTNAKKGFYLGGELTPWYGLKDTGSGARLRMDGRAYRSFGSDDHVTLAGRVQLGTIIGADAADTPYEYLFWSGGGGLVRGQEYKSLGNTALTGSSYNDGTLSLAALSAEVRVDVTEKIGAVAFVDAGMVTADNLWQGDNAWHAGAGLGVRYRTPIGPIRLDVAAPVGGYDSGKGVQAYIGIGQAF